jgi:hypothetical protein
VDGDWEPSPAIAKQEEDEDEFWGEEEFEPIEGCTEKNVGWMRISPIMIMLNSTTCWIVAMISGRCSTNDLPPLLSGKLAHGTWVLHDTLLGG